MTANNNGQTFTMTVKDGANNSFTNIATYIPNAGFAQYIYAIATPAGDVGTMPVLTAHTSTGSPLGMAILVQEVSGLATIPTADGSPGTSNGSASNGANFGPPVYSDGSSGEYLVYATYDTGSSGTLTAPAGYTADINNVQGTSASVLVAYASSTGGTESGHWHNATGSGYGYNLIMVAFELPPPPYVFSGKVRGNSFIPCIPS